MAESIQFNPAYSKAQRYEQIIPQIASLLSYESDLVANLANVSAVLREVFGFFWVGFYWVKDDQLVLGPFQGPLACTRIAKGRGVCGNAWQEARTLIVEDVEQFPGHIACSSWSKSEIVVPVIRQGEVIGVLDVDSDRLADFDTVDQVFLERICQLIVQTC